MGKWTNIQTGKTINSDSVPEGGSDAGWVPGSSAPSVEIPTDINAGVAAPADLSIGETNWKNLVADPKYSPEALAYATELKDGSRYWRADRHIEDFGTSGDVITQPKADPDIKITADSFEDVGDLSLPGVTDGDTGADIPAGAAQTAKTLDDYIKENTPPETEADQKKDDLSQAMTDLMGETADMGADQLAEETNRNLPQLRTDFADLNAEILRTTAEYDALKVDIEGKPITMSSIIGQQAQVEKKKLAEIGILQARALGLQGQIETAQAAADRAVDIKYSTIETRLKIYQAQLDMISDEVNEEQAIFLNARRQMLSDQQQLLAERKTVEKSINAMALTAQANGADGALVNKIINARSEVEAAQIAGELATSEGWSYVGTIAERDALVAQGYEITQSGGRTYVRKAEEGLLSIAEAKSLGVPYGTTKQDAINMGIIPKTSSSSGGTTTLKPEDEMNQQLSTVVGSDGFVSPDDYLTARNAWIEAGLSPTTFDTRFRGFKNPNNPYYVINKTTSSGDREL